MGLRRCQLLQEGCTSCYCEFDVMIWELILQFVDVDVGDFDIVTNHALMVEVRILKRYNL